MPTLYLVGTPIGNLEDMTLRAIRILGEVSLIAAEDTRKTGRLLSHYNIDTPMLSYHDYSSPKRIATLIDRVTEGDVALVSDAGMPGLSDPGFRLVRAAIEAGIRIIPIPGPSAVITSLVASGLPTDRFLYLGYLPRRKTARRKAVEEVKNLVFTLVIYEAPHRLLDLLTDLRQVLGDRHVCIGRELTKYHEEIWRGSLSQAEDYFGQNKIRGEFTLVVSGSDAKKDRWEESRVRSTLRSKMDQGLSRKQAAAAITTESGWRKREIYDLDVDSEDEVATDR